MRGIVFVFLFPKATMEWVEPRVVFFVLRVAFRERNRDRRVLVGYVVACTGCVPGYFVDGQQPMAEL